MVHSIGSYHAAALGHLAIYHMHDPQSVAIAQQGKRWVLSQARGVRNTMPYSRTSKRG